VLRLASVPVDEGPSNDDLLALADAVREAARPPAPAPRPVAEEGARETRRLGHLRVLTSD
jgi:hypothetical protein